MPELLLELLSEEIPARMQARAAEDLKRLICQGLRDEELEFDRAEAFATPRRLALVIDGLPAQQSDKKKERKGPRVGAPEKATNGFLKSAGLNSLDQCEVREVGGHEFYFVVTEKKGRPIEDILHEIVYRTIWNFPWPKSMRWGDMDLRWVRPIQNLLMIFDGRVPHTPIPMLSVPKSKGEKIDDSPSLNASNKTFGHRFLAPSEITVKDFVDYKKKLKAAKVILDPAERRAVIVKQAKRKAARAKLTLRDDPALLDEVTGLVEWPVVLMGRIDPEFMDLPPEVLTTAMRTHQKYLALVDESGALANRFLVVANMETADQGKGIVAGNERVLRARLADARFFWDQDRKQTLESRIDDLDGVVFHAKLGSVGEKVRRIEKLSAEISAYVPNTEAGAAREAARLAKADLTTGMVGEFPELQGVMGRYYALADGENSDVAQAIAEHYSPLGPNDACPSAPVSVVVALADKLDTLAGFFGIDEKPTGSKDPYGLRRAALGVIRLIVENELRLRLGDLIHDALAIIVRQKLTEDHSLGANRSLEFTVDDWVGNELAAKNLLNFIADRLKAALREKNVRHDLISAVFAIGGEDDLVRLLARVDALAKFLDTDDGANLLVAYRRAANIVRIEEKRDKLRYHGAELAIDQLVEEAERTLGLRVFDSEAAAETALEAEDFTAAMAALAKLRRPVDDFFDRVTVNTENPELRANRLRLLARIGATLDQVADFSKIEG